MLVTFVRRSDQEARITTALTLRLFTAHDAMVVATWFPDVGSAVAFAGSGAVWPVDPAELLARNDRPDVEPLTAVAPAPPSGADGPPGPAAPGGAGAPPDAGAVLGHVEIVRVTATTGRLARIALAPAVRGRGLSSALLDAAIARARDTGIRELALLVVPGNTPALRAYAAAGFARTPPDPDHPEYVRLARDV